MRSKDDRRREIRACFEGRNSFTTREIAKVTELGEEEVGQLLRQMPEVVLVRVLHATEEWRLKEEQKPNDSLETQSVTRFFQGISP
jgi:hypothetical protein